MSYSPADIEAIAKKLRYDLSAAQAKVTELLNAVSDLASRLPADDHAYRCPDCQIDCPTAKRLEEHRENVHGVRT